MSILPNLHIPVKVSMDSTTKSYFQMSLIHLEGLFIQVRSSLFFPPFFFSSVVHCSCVSFHDGHFGTLLSVFFPTWFLPAGFSAFAFPGLSSVLCHPSPVKTLVARASPSLLWFIILLLRTCLSSPGLVLPLVLILMSSVVLPFATTQMNSFSHQGALSCPPPLSFLGFFFSSYKYHMLIAPLFPTFSHFSTALPSQSQQFPP